MKRIADSGTQIYFTRGNRDFLVGENYLDQFGATLLGDSVCIEVAGESTLLMHGDLLCSDDVDYLAFRAIAHNPEWQAEMLSKSLDERRALAKQLRAMSKEAASNKAEDIMDVNDDTVRSVMAEHGVTRLIHGHTHRPCRHHCKTPSESCWATGIRSAGVCENKEHRWSYANSRFNCFVSDYRHAAVKAYLGILTFNELLFYRAK